MAKRGALNFFTTNFLVKTEFTYFSTGTDPEGRPDGPGYFLRKKKSRWENGKGKERKEKEKEKGSIKKLSRHNLFIRAYIGLHWPMGVGAE